MFDFKAISSNLIVTLMVMVLLCWRKFQCYLHDFSLCLTGLEGQQYDFSNYRVFTFSFFVISLLHREAELCYGLKLIFSSRLMGHILYCWQFFGRFLMHYHSLYRCAWLFHFFVPHALSSCRFGFVSCNKFLKCNCLFTSSYLCIVHLPLQLYS